MKVQVLVSLWNGLFDVDPRVFTDKGKAEEARKAQMKDYDIVEGREQESNNEVHLYEDIEVE